MRGIVRTLTALALSAALTLTAAPPALGADAGSCLEKTARYMQKAVPSPVTGSSGGEWAVIGLVRCGMLTQGQRAAYLEGLEQTVQACQGVLSARKYSEYARVVLALAALGEDPGDVAGYDLTAPLLDREMVAFQGVNGPIFALIALDSGLYAGQEARAACLEDILAAQLEDGGWSLARSADPDVTAQALQALAPYAKTDARAGQAVARGLARLEALWEAGAFVTSESCAQALIAYAALDLQPPQGLLEALLSYRQEDGSFAHLPGGGGDQMATEQALCALCALARQERGLPALYDMSQSGWEQEDPAMLAALLRAARAVPGRSPLAA